MLCFHVILLLICVYLTDCRLSLQESSFRKKTPLRDILFPNRTAHDQGSRNLNVVKIPYTTPVTCVGCQDLKLCNVINNLQLQEVYYPLNPDTRGTCLVIEALGQRLGSEIFGQGRSFRDTPECRDMVMQYLCLFWGSNNDMYTNYCIYQEDTSDPNILLHKVAPRPPCRSFCVQVATVCSNDPEFIQLCYDIACPPTEHACTPDPTVTSQVLAAGLGCAMPYDKNPYAKSSATPRSQILTSQTVLYVVTSTSALLALALFN